MATFAGDSKAENESIKLLLSNDGNIRDHRGSIQSKVTLFNACKCVFYLLLYGFGILYCVVWILALEQNNNRLTLNIFGDERSFEFRKIYKVLGIILHIFIITICLIFFTKYVYYSKYLKYKKKLFNLKNRMSDILNNETDNTDYNDDSNNNIDKLKQKYKNEKFHKKCCGLIDKNKRLTCKDITGIIYYYCISLFDLKWTEFNIISILCLLYHLILSVLYIKSKNKDNATEDTYRYDEKWLYIINYFLSGFGVILPGICINVCQRWKHIFQFVSPGSPSITYRGSKFEDNEVPDIRDREEESRRLSKALSNKTSKTILEMRNILNDKIIRFWIFFIFMVQFVIFITEPSFNEDAFRNELFVIYDCNSLDPTNGITTYTCDLFGIIFFYINTLILRLFVPMVLLNTLILCVSFDKKYMKSKLDGIKYVLSPSSFGLIIFLLLIEITLWDITDGVTAMIILWTVIIIFTALFQCYNFVHLLDIQDKAYRENDRLYAYMKSEPFLYFIEGLILLLFIVICGACLLIDSNDRHTPVMFRAGCILLFNSIQIAILLPLRTIDGAPSYKKKFQNPKKRKYLMMFRWMCYLNIYNIFYSFIFVCEYFNDLLTNNDQNDTYLYAFGLVFSQCHFNIWALTQFLPWVYPHKSHEKQIHIEISEIRNKSFDATNVHSHRNNNNISNNNSKLITPSSNIDLKYNDDNDTFDDNIGILNNNGEYRKRKIKKSSDNNGLNNTFTSPDSGMTSLFENYDDMARTFKIDKPHQKIEPPKPKIKQKSTNIDTNNNDNTNKND